MEFGTAAKLCRGISALIKIWQGAKDGELVKIWDYITILCIYLGNSENFLLVICRVRILLTA